MGQALRLDIPDKIYESLLRRAEQIGRTPEQVAIQYLSETVEQVQDPLLELAGVLESDLNDIAERHDDYVGQGVTERLKIGRNA